MSFRRLTFALALLAAGTAGCSGGGGTPPAPPTPSPTPSAPAGVLQISQDPFVNPSTQHRTEVEPHLFAVGNTVVAAFQVGRSISGGSSDIGFASSFDAGGTWTSGFLPAMTVVSTPPGPFDTVSDPVVAYDAAHAVWLIASLPVLFSNAPTPAVLVNRSSDGRNWSDPISVAPDQVASDKDWIACDDARTSPFYGHCYVEWDDPSAQANGLIHMSVSADGGQTWSPPATTADRAQGIGGQPLVRPNGTVVVPIDDFNLARVLAFVSSDGGATWGPTTVVSTIVDHADAGGIRSGPLPSAAVDGAGTTYVVWQDCRFRAGCAANDLVSSTSSDGVHWSGVARIPIDATTSTVDHFIPGLGIDPTTSGGGAHVGLTYYYYPQTACTRANCKLEVGFVGSTDGGTSWSAPQTLAGPMSLDWLAATSLGSMVGDYIATAFAAARPIGVFAIGLPLQGVLYDEAMYVPRVAPGPKRSTTRRRTREPIRSRRSDHPLRHGPFRLP
jgi:hypothetical protein